MKHLVLRKTDITRDINHYDCYYDVNVELAIPTEYVIDLSANEMRLLNQHNGGLIFIPILEKKEVKELLATVRADIKKKAERKAAAAAKREETARKRKATAARKKREKELAELEKLKKKYEK